MTDETLDEVRLRVRMAVILHGMLGETATVMTAAAPLGVEGAAEAALQLRAADAAALLALPPEQAIECLARLAATVEDFTAAVAAREQTLREAG